MDGIGRLRLWRLRHNTGKARHRVLIIRQITIGGPRTCREQLILFLGPASAHEARDMRLGALGWGKGETHGGGKQWNAAELVCVSPSGKYLILRHLDAR